MSEPSEDKIRDTINHYNTDWTDDSLSEKIQECDELIKEFDEAWDDLFKDLELLKIAVNNADITDCAEEVASSLEIIEYTYDHLAEKMLTGRSGDEDTADWVELMTVREKNVEQRFYNICNIDVYEATSASSLWSLAEVYRDEYYADSDQTPDILTNMYSDSVQKTIHNILYYSPQYEFAQNEFKKAIATQEYEEDQAVEITEEEVEKKLKAISMADEGIKRPDTLQVAINNLDYTTKNLQDYIHLFVEKESIQFEELDNIINDWTSELAFLADVIMSDKEIEKPQEVLSSILHQSILDQYEAMAVLDPKFDIQTMNSMQQKLIVDMLTSYDEDEEHSTFGGMLPQDARKSLRSNILKNIALLTSDNN